MIAHAVESKCVTAAAYTNEKSTRIKIEWSEWDERHGRFSREVAVERSGQLPRYKAGHFLLL